MSHSSRSRILLVLLAVIALTVGVVSSAFGSVNDIPYPLGESSTNPGAISSPDSNWRRGWGNATTMEFLLNLPQANWAEEGYIRHVHYRFDRNFTATPVVPGGQRVDMSTVFPDAAKVEIKKDIRAHWLKEPASAWNYVAMQGQKHPWEGLWALSYRFEADGPASGESILGTPTIGPVVIGIDVTPPWPVEKLRAKPSERYTGPTGTWTDSPDAYVFWKDMEYDDLSKTAHFEVQVNGGQRGEPVFYLPPTRPYVTIHDMPPGKSTIRVRAVDRATNKGPWRTTNFYSDPDKPKLSITSPATKGDLVGARYTFAANATDLAGIRWVRFEIDGRSVGVAHTAPHQVTLDMTAYANGTHTLRVTAADMLGREVTKVREFTLDKTPPTISNVWDGPDPFYPIMQEGYKDSMVVHFNVDKNVRAHLYIYDANDNLYATRSALRNAGYANLVWDGKGDADDQARTGTFFYRLRAQDAAGNVTWWSKGATTIRDYEIIRIGPNAVRVIPR